MTRGTLYIITNEAVYSSTEFNGDMGYNDLGKEAVKLLKKTTNLEEFKEKLATFNNKHYGYAEDMVYKATEKKNAYKWYGKKIYDYELRSYTWQNYNLFPSCCPTSDYNYIKNLSDTIVVINCQNGDHILKPGEILITQFAKFYKRTATPEKVA